VVSIWMECRLNKQLLNNYKALLRARWSADRTHNS
jgi:hypothetical protein